MPKSADMTHISHLAQFGLFDARVPRYTSYPTAPQFSAAVGQAEYINWVKGIAPDSQISLYMHVPFCRRLCWFCACRTQGTSTDAPLIAYAKTLLAEIALLRAHLPKGVTLSRLHWGGGTPTLMPPQMMAEIGAAIFAALPLADGGEFSVEIDPNEIDLARLTALSALGMNRASIGVQDFNPEVQAAIGREQPFYVTRQVAQMIRDVGVASLNVDILFGLPHQSDARMAESVMQLLSLQPYRIALYGYAHVPWMSRRQQMIPADALPTPRERLQLFDRAAQILAQAGYESIGIDHFALPSDGMARAAKAGQLRRNFQGYTDDTAPVLLGLGASSISRFGAGFVQNAARTADYAAAIAAGQFSASKGHVFTPDDRLRGAMIEQVMCEFAIDRAGVARRMGAGFAQAEGQFDALLAQTYAAFEQVCDLDADGLRIRPDSIALTRLIARSLDAYDTSKAQHSAAI
jgi:oxygen-independent coproporphyrinogen III oxidase